MKVRLDKALVERGIAGSRERAQALVLAGRVLVAGQRVDKPGTQVDPAVALRLLGDDLRYVGRGGLKLERALDYWRIALDGQACLDVGASTGGFTDCMLQHGAARVLAVDTGYGQIAHKLRVDPRVRLRERCNARLLRAGELLESTTRGERQRAEDAEPRNAELRDAEPRDAEPRNAEPRDAEPRDAEPRDAEPRNAEPRDAEPWNAEPGPEKEQISSRSTDDDGGRTITFLAMDVSFISATLVLPAVLRALDPAGAHWRGQAVVLIKPQFEVGREDVGKGGIVRRQAAREIAIERVRLCVAEQGGTGIEVIDSPIHGMEGNHEYLLHAGFGEAEN